MIHKYWQLTKSRVLYWMGLAVHFVMDKWADVEDENGDPHWIFDKLYPAYNWCMGRSCDLDEWDVLWKPAPSKDSSQ